MTRSNHDISCEKNILNNLQLSSPDTVTSNVVLNVNNDTPVLWNHRKQFSQDRFMRYLQKSLDQGKLSNDGPLQAVLGAKVKAAVRSVNDVLLACNGTAALHALCIGLNLKYQKEIRWITQAFTFSSCINGSLAACQIADVDPEHFGPSFAYLENHVDEFDGIIVTNVFGLQTNLLKYQDWCDRHDKLLIQDNAASPIGFVENTKHTCIHDLGDGAIVSFHETKPFGRAEGGAIFARNDVLTFVHQAMNFGFNIPANIRRPHRACSNWRMSDVAAAAICDHLDFMESNDWEERLQDLTKFAESCLESNGLQLAFPVQYPTILSCLFIRLNEGNTPEKALRRLFSHNIEAKHLYVPLCGRNDAPEAWKLFDSTICLPFHLEISRSQLRRIIQVAAGNMSH
jgi:dTDP-4-amino-4,6-dideoxygalactose transaminase